MSFSWADRSSIASVGKSSGSAAGGATVVGGGGTGGTGGAGEEVGGGVDSAAATGALLVLAFRLNNDIVLPRNFASSLRCRSFARLKAKFLDGNQELFFERRRSRLREAKENTMSREAMTKARLKQKSRAISIKYANPELRRDRKIVITVGPHFPVTTPPATHRTKRSNTFLEPSRPC